MPTRPRVHNPYLPAVRRQVAEKANVEEQARQAGRASAHQRGYTRRWLAASRDHRRRNPWCVRCLERDKVTVATDTDHKIPHKGNATLFWDQTNWQSLCARCHGIKTATEDGGYGRPVIPRPPRHLGPP